MRAPSVRTCRSRRHGPWRSGLALAALALAPAPAAPSEPYPGLVLFGRDASDVETFFQSHDCLVGHLKSIERSAEGVTAVILYPSGNVGPDGRGSTVIYPHRVRISEPEGEAPGLDDVDHERHAVVLASPPSRDGAYRLLGLVEKPKDEALPWDYFADKPALWYRDRER